MKVPEDDRHNTISNTRVLHGDADVMYTPKSLLADSPEDCQCSPKSAFIVAFLLTLFYLKKGQTRCCVREILISSVSSRKAGLLSHRRKQNSSCSALHEALVQLFLFQPAPQTARKKKFKPCCILLQCYAAGAISLPCFQDCNLTLSKPDGSDWQEFLQVDKSQHRKKKKKSTWPMAEGAITCQLFN